MKVKYDGLYRMGQDNACFFLLAYHSVVGNRLVANWVPGL